ncbi:hypothetical protein TTHERM_00102700 (macronuclear) [Tetrahymena thermophila SB210]|uniref:Uncharacterized protein n=1 Tax=Tetrahymena thermophila (strain SB210) TaxID=312017 RepID=Q234M8_TETTS|nr:hypothetical protein TTHERM_00102700 [Tetrahymena thermophila SB210]EAR91975.1 hypothetical protein TTHERM_00102700 [Tetrahymena thermophila SB210]|eukprot:XP_001012220.1 hypothetical protein TTHERM_00102700 [Tetrahymena thermophila SB210]
MTLKVYNYLFEAVLFPDEEFDNHVLFLENEFQVDVLFPENQDSNFSLREDQRLLRRKGIQFGLCKTQLKVMNFLLNQSESYNQLSLQQKQQFDHRENLFGQQQKFLLMIDEFEDQFEQEIKLDEEEELIQKLLLEKKNQSHIRHYKKLQVLHQGLLVIYWNYSPPNVISL